MSQKKTVKTMAYAEAQAASLRKIARDNFDPDLTPAELRILNASALPGPAEPLKDGSHVLRKVRPSFMRWLVTDPDVLRHVDPNGFQIVSALFEDDLDLSSCTISKDITFEDCDLAAPLILSSADVQGIYFFDCHLDRGMNSRNMRAAGDLTFTSVQLGGNVESDGSKFERGVFITNTTTSKDVQFLSFRNIETSAGFEVREKVVLYGTLNLEESKIGGEFSLWSIELAGEPGLILGGARISRSCSLVYVKAKSNLFLDGLSASSVNLLGLKIAGSSSDISLYGAQIHGDLQINYGFAGDETFETEAGVSMNGGSIDGDVICAPVMLHYLRMTNVVVSGTFLWHGAFNKVRASLDLTQSRVEAFFDDKAGWPDHGQLKIDGFVYKELNLCIDPSVQDVLGHKPSKLLRPASTGRIEWLERQSGSDILNKQPWDQVARILDALGDQRGARHVRFTYQSLVSKRQTPVRRAASVGYHWIEEDPIRISIPLVSFWAVGFLVYRRAARMKAMAPTESSAQSRFRRGEDISDYPPFNPAIYALENTLPALKLGHDAKWGPDPLPRDSAPRPLRERLFTNYKFLVWLRWTLIVLGWALTLILAGAIGHIFAS